MKTIRQACEFCWEKPAEFITYTRKFSWKFCCIDCEEDIEFYHICLERLVTEEWVKHLSEKNWFYDTKDEFLKRYCYARNMYGKKTNLKELLKLVEELSMKYWR